MCGCVFVIQIEAARIYMFNCFFLLLVPLQHLEYVAALKIHTFDVIFISTSSLPGYFDLKLATPATLKRALFSP